MRVVRLVLVVLGVGGLALGFSTAAVADHEVSTGINCDDFDSQREAQEFLRDHPADPEGLDGPPGEPSTGQPGVACEDNPAPFDRNPVPHRTRTTATTAAPAPPAPVASIPASPAATSAPQAFANGSIIVSNEIVAAAPAPRPRSRVAAKSVTRSSSKAELADTGVFSETLFAAALALLLIGASLYGSVWRPVGKHWGR